MQRALHLQAFNSMVDRMMARSPVNGLNVYPEGDASCVTSTSTPCCNY